MASSLFRRKTIDSILKDSQTGTGDAHAHGLKRVLTVRDLTFFWDCCHYWRRKL